jgi:NAD(P)H-dependent FMN reductase
MATLTVITGSTRPGRAGAAIAEWFAGHARACGCFANVGETDLAELNLPMLDEPNHPRLHQYSQPHTIAWSETVQGSDAFVLVTPEYNHGYPAPLKNALDFLSQEWSHKPVAFISYGGLAAGTRAVQQLIEVVTALGMVPINRAVAIPFFNRLIDDTNRLAPDETTLKAADALLDELARVEVATRSLRNQPV